MEAFFNRGICRALQDCAIAELQAENARLRGFEFRVRICERTNSTVSAGWTDLAVGVYSSDKLLLEFQLLSGTPMVTLPLASPKCQFIFCAQRVQPGVLGHRMHVDVLKRRGQQVYRVSSYDVLTLKVIFNKAQFVQFCSQLALALEAYDVSNDWQAGVEEWIKLHAH